MYGCEAWTMTANLTKAIDGVYTRMLIVVHQVSWRDHITNLPKLKFAGHCYRNSELVASQLVLWQPTHGKKNKGRQRATYVDTLLKDTGLNTVDEVANCMGNRDVWQAMSTRGRQPDRSKIKVSMLL